MPDAGTHHEGALERRDLGRPVRELLIGWIAGDLDQAGPEFHNANTGRVFGGPILEHGACAFGLQDDGASVLEPKRRDRSEAAGSAGKCRRGVSRGQRA